jgi:hypothetical protein
MPTGMAAAVAQSSSTIEVFKGLLAGAVAGTCSRTGTHNNVFLFSFFFFFPLFSLLFFLKQQNVLQVFIDYDYCNTKQQERLHWKD